MGSKDKPSANSKGKPRLQLKGRIYMANVTDVVLLQKPGMVFQHRFFSCFASCINRNIFY